MAMYPVRLLKNCLSSFLQTDHIMIIKCKITRIGENNVDFIVKLTLKQHSPASILDQKGYVEMDGADIYVVLR